MDTPDRLRHLREERGYSKYHVANAVEMSQSTYSYWENKAPVQLTWLSDICKFYGVSADYVLGLTDNPQGYHGASLPDEVVALVDVVRGAGVSKRTEILEVARVMVARWREETIAAMTGEPQKVDATEDIDGWAEKMIEALPDAMRTALLDTLVRVENVATISDAGRAFEMVTEEEQQQGSAVVSHESAE